MKCLVCNYAGEFGTIRATGEFVFLLGRMPEPIGNVGSVDIHVCPNCGMIHSDMRGNIKMKNRKRVK